MTYYVLQCSEDGDVSLRSYTKDELEEALACGDIDGADAKIANVHDFASGKVSLVIIKGEAIMPKPTKQVTAWEV
jgi:hypothetical protein